MNEKPEALRLADAMWAGRLDYGIAGEIAAELRRLHAENERLTKKNERLREALQDIARQPEGDEDSAQAVAKAALRREET